MPWRNPPAWCTEPTIITLITVSLLGVGSFISTLEWLVNRHQFARDGLLSFEVLGSRPLLTGTGLYSRILRKALSYRSYCTALVLRLASLAALPVFVALHQSLPILGLLAIILVTSFLIHVRSPFGLDGSDQMTTQVYGALFLALLIGGPALIKIALWYIAAQSALSYFTSGTAKLVSPIWRQGGVTHRVFNTRTYGLEPIARMLQGRPLIARALDWTAIAAEMLFPLCLVCGFPLVMVFLAWGILFHFASAAIMGLNSFFWAFVATYPALLYTAVTIQLHLLRH
jgi:hypothetical protein